VVVVRLCVLTLFAAFALPAGTEPKSKASDYPKHMKLEALDIGAEYLARLTPDGHFAGNYIVVEVALFPDRRKEIDVALSYFRLRVNGRELAQLAQSPQSVAFALKNPEAEGFRGPQASIGAGQGSVIVGGPARTGRFPGDPQARRAPRPEPRDQDQQPPDPATQPLSDFEAAVRFALDEGRSTTARSGLVYFYWNENLKKIRSLELIYEGPAGKASLAIR
jgi:hypothetical protein